MMTTKQGHTSNEIAGYSRMQKTLHWAVVVMIAAQYLVFDSIGRYFEAQMQNDSTAYNLTSIAHIVLGVLVFMATGTRIFLRLRQVTPARARTAPTRLDLVAKGTHHLLYALLIAIPISGLAAWFAAAEALAEIHALLTNLLLAVMALHVMGALYHQFVMKDGLLRRML